MAKIHLDRIKEKFGWTGHNYKVLMSGIIADNAQRVHNSVLQVDHKILENSMKKISAKERALNLPRLSDVIKPQSQWTRKGADRGKLITDNLKDKLSRDLRTILDKPEYMRQRGRLTGTLKNQALLDMRETMKKTFKNYTKVDPTIGIPKNIKAIVSTELRSVINQTKDEYNQKLLRANPDIIILKKWIHNGNVWGSKDYIPRRYHKQLHGETIPFAENFKIKDEKKNITYHVPHPHYETLPPEQVINCNCEIQTIARKLRVKEVNKSIVEKAWQVKSGKWHDYDESGKVVEVPSPGKRGTAKETYDTDFKPSVGQTLSYYQGQGFHNMNSILRGSRKLKEDATEEEKELFHKNTNYIHGYINKMDEYIENSKERGVYVFRGDGGAISSTLFETHKFPNDFKIKSVDDIFNYKIDGKNIDKYLTDEFKGSIFQDNGYVSTSKSKDIAQTRFNPGNYEINKFGGSGIVEIVGNSKGIDPSEITGVDTEKEFILPRGTKFKVESVQVLPHEDGIRLYLHWRVSII